MGTRMLTSWLAVATFTVMGRRLAMLSVVALDQAMRSTKPTMQDLKVIISVVAGVFIL